MKWRCVNHEVGDCDGEPNWDTQPSELQTKDNGGVTHLNGICLSNWRNCGKYKALVDTGHTGTGVKVTVTPPTKETKVKVKKDKKESAQGTLF